MILLVDYYLQLFYVTVELSILVHFYFSLLPMYLLSNKYSVHCITIAPKGISSFSFYVCVKKWKKNKKKIIYLIWIFTHTYTYTSRCYCPWRLELNVIEKCYVDIYFLWVITIYNPLHVTIIFLIFFSSKFIIVHTVAWYPFVPFISLHSFN